MDATTPPADSESPEDLPVPPVARRRRAFPLAVGLSLAAWIAFAAWFEGRRVDQGVARLVEEAQGQVRARATIVEAALLQSLGRVDGIAATVAALPQVVAVAGAPSGAAGGGTSEAGAAALVPMLRVAGEQLGADLLFVTDAGGRVLATNRTGAADVTGVRVDDRTYFREARTGGHGRQFVVGRQTGIPGLYFSAAIQDGGRFLGIVAAKRDTTSLATLVGHDGAFVTDVAGVVVMGQDGALLMHAMPGSQALAVTDDERRDRYGRPRLPVARFERWTPDAPAGLMRFGDDAVPQVLVSRATRDGDFVVYVAQPVPDVLRLEDERLRDGVLLAGVGTGLIGLFFAGFDVLRSRRRSLAMVAELGAANRRLSREVDRRERAQAALQQSRWVLETQDARLNAVLRSVPEQVWMKDPAGVYLSVNVAYERFHGRAAADVLGRTDLDLHGPVFSDRYRLEDEAAMAAQEPLRTAEWEMSADGRRTWLEIARTAARDEHGRVLGVVAVARDATEIHQAQVALKTSEARFRATFETAGDAILIVREGIVVDCNARAQQLFAAADRMALLGLALQALGAEAQRQPGEPQVLARDRVAEAKTGTRRPFEWRCRRLDGEEFDAEITLSVFTHGGIRLLQAVIRDVSERRRMMAEIEAARDEAERANRSKSVFLANMSHEIRTPLNAVLGFTQLLLADHRLPAATLQRLGVIHAAGQRLLGLINDVLDLAKIESGSVQVVNAPFDLAQELADIAVLFEANARAKGLVLTTSVDLGGTTVAEGDRTKVGQIVQNLLGNAIKFTEHGRVKLVVRRQGDTVGFVVEDTGVGIRPDELSRLFVPFRQGDAGQEKGGTGLGLVLARDMARAMGGELSLESSPGVGTRVEAVLPLPASEVRLDEDWYVDGRQRLAEGTSCRVLVVEDDADSREVLAQVLRTAGCTVVEAGDGEEGLAACDGGRFDIVFTDIRMPRLDGIRMIERLRALPGTQALPVVAVSASSLEHERRFYLERGFQDFIGKPYPFHEVYRMLVQHAGAQLHRVDEAPQGEGAGGDGAAEAGAPPIVIGTPTHRRLVDLADAAARGEVAGVRRALAELGPDAVGSARWRLFEEAAQGYDFQGLETRVRAVVAGASARPVVSHDTDRMVDGV
jgi:PAS domain S-box-containing protein